MPETDLCTQDFDHIHSFLATYRDRFRKDHLGEITDWDDDELDSMTDLTINGLAELADEENWD